MKLAIAVALGVLFLRVFYGAVRLQWPANYYGASDLSSYSISASPVRFAVYRLAPVYLVCSTVAVSLDRMDSHPALGSFLVAAVHGGTTLLRALYSWARSIRGLRRHRVPIALIRFVMLMAVLATAWVASTTRESVDVLVPPIREVGTSLWTAAFAGVAGAWAIQASRSGGVTGDTLVRLSRQQIRSELWVLARREANAQGADPVLVRAVMLVENLQRPHWFRILENVKGRLIKQGSYGVMQVTNDKPVSDEDSIRLAVARHFVDVNVRSQYGSYETAALTAFARQYNPSRNFLELLEFAWHEVQEWDRTHVRTGSSLRIGLDGLPVIEAEVVQVRPGSLVVSGSAMAYEGTVVVDALLDDTLVLSKSCQADRGAPERGRWQCELAVPAEVNRLVIHQETMEETPPSVTALEMVEIRLDDRGW